MALRGVVPRLASRARRPWASDPELLVDQPRDLGAVGAALGLAHHVADDRADRLGVAVAHALGGVRVGGERRRDDARRAPRRRRSPRGPRPRRSRPRSPPSASRRSSTWRAAPTLTCLAATRPTSAGERRRARRASRPGPRRPADARASSPVTQLASTCGGGGGSTAARERRLEVVAQLGAEGEQPCAVRAQPQLALAGARARSAGSSGSAARGAVEHLPRRSPPARGRARGSSGSRAPPPWSAAR